jgi:putative phage-type endonuclease
MLSPEELKLVGGSDVSALVGLNPYKTAHDVFARIVLGREDPETKAMRRGTLMEPVIRELAREEFGLKFAGPRKYRHAPFLRASLDDVLLVDGEEQVAEFKSVGPFAAGEYGEQGTDEVPTHHLCQVQTYLWVSKMPQAHLFALVGVDDMRRYIIHPDSEFQAMLLDAAERFWVDNVLTGTPPAVDASESCARFLAERFPRNEGSFLSATDEAARWAQQLRVERENKERAEEAEAEARNHLIALIGSADGIVGDSWRITNKLVKGRAKTDWEAVAVEAGAPVELVKKHTTIGAGYRRFLPKFQET